MIVAETQKIFFVILMVGILTLMPGGTAQAQARIGVLAGISAQPNQVYFGAHVDATEIVDRFWFRPGLEVGFGDGLTLTTLNAEFVYKVPAKSRVWTPYFGGGPGLVLESFRSSAVSHDTHVGPGFNFIAGVEKRRGLMTEIKVGVLDSPSFKLGVGWTW